MFKRDLLSKGEGDLEVEENAPSETTGTLLFFRTVTWGCLFLFYVAVLIGLTQIFFYGHSLWFQWNIGFVRLSGYYEGMERGLLLASRVFGRMSVMLLLTMSTSVQEWVSALAWFKVPLTVIEIMTLAYSSLFVLLEELERLQKAQRMRLGYESWWQIVRATGTVGGILFMRVFDRGYRLWQAMLCRGYNGKIQVSYERKLSRRDVVVAVLGLVLIMGMEIGKIVWLF